VATQCPKCHSDNPDTQKFCGECATPLQPSEDISVFFTKTLETPKVEITRGAILADRYEIIEELGKGGMGDVYRVVDKKINEEVALKLLKPEIAADKKTLGRFSNELKLARQIVHKNVGRMYHLGEDKGTYYITMEYVSGEDLKSLIRRMGRIPTEKAISISKQISEGLSEAHSLGVVHRDLKPSNIMIDRQGNARIMDFGIARSITAKGITDRGVMIGTPEYLSPEQAETKEVDHRSDIYSLGVILYEMVAGQRPFEGETALSVARKHADETPRDPKEINPQIPDDLSHLILRCLEKDKGNRYQSTGELRAELENLEKGIPTTDRTTPKRKPLTSKEITVTFGLKRLLIPALAVVALAIIAIVIWQLLPEKEVVPSAPVKPSIAVLAFEDLSPQKDQEYFCDGIAEEIINTLTQIKDLRVIARTSAFAFKGRHEDVREIGRKLDVDTLLEGSVRKAGNRLRITTQLISASDGSQLWAKKYEKELEDVFEIQDEISLAIVDHLKLKLLGREKATLVKRHTENVEAYQLCLLGRHHWNKWSPEGWRKGIEYFEKAIEVDPNYALAYAWLGYAYTPMAVFRIDMSPMDAWEKAKSLTLKALEIDDQIDLAYASLGFIQVYYDWDWEGAERSLKKAIALNPNLPETWENYGIHYLGVIGKIDEALEGMERALELDPFNPRILGNTGYMYIAKDQYDLAIELANRIIETAPNPDYGYEIRGTAYELKGMLEEANKDFQMARSLAGWELEHASRLGYNYAIQGKKSEALAILDELKNSQNPKDMAVLIAIIYLGLGDKNKALEWLEIAYRERSFSLVFYLNSNPRFNSLRSDPRFQKLLKKMNFPE
jgi:serine/threonine protein kinase/tetratricopeptide (TPR) repeat protein